MALSPTPESNPIPSVNGRLLTFPTCSSLLAVWVQAPLTPSSDLPNKSFGSHPHGSSQNVPRSASPGVGVPGEEFWWLPEGQSAVVSVSVSMSASRSECIGVRLCAAQRPAVPLSHSAALSAFPFKYHLPLCVLPPRHLVKLSRP